MNPEPPLIHTESILKVLSEPILVLDLSDDIVVANAAFCQLLQVTPERLEGVPLRELLATAEDPQLHAVLESAVGLDSDLSRKEIACSIPPDTFKTLSMTVRRMGEDLLNPEAGIVELRDVTPEKETMRKLQELNTALLSHGRELERINSDLESFNRWISHDLRTPLRFTNTVANRLMEKHNEVLPEDAKKSLQMILDSTKEMGKLIENLLAFSQVDKVPLRKRNINMTRLVRETMSGLQHLRNDRDLEIQLDDLPPCRADRALLKQVFQNLLENALVFTKPCEHPRIHVGSYQDDAGTVYFVRDNGVGFKPSQVETLFALFRKVSTDQHLEGTGIGLTLVKRVIERHGGLVWAEGEPSCGATFFFQIEN